MGMRYTEIQAKCGSCGHTLRLSRSSFIMKKRALGYYPCPECRHPMSWEDAGGGRSDSQRRSRSQEKRAARRYGMRQQAASGSKVHAKSDLRDPGKFRGEMKETIRGSFSLKLETLLKLEKEADTAEVPLLEIEFQGVHPFKRYVVLPEWAFTSLKENQK